MTPLVAGVLLPPIGRPMPSLGEAVEAGQVVARIQLPSFDILSRIAEADAAVARTAVAMEQAESILARTRKLSAESARSARDVEDAQYAARQARIDREAASALRDAYRKLEGPADAEASEVRLPTLDLEAPIAGIITRLAASPGESVSPEGTVAEILDPSRIHIEAHVPEAHLARLGDGLAAAIETAAAPDREEPIEMTGGRIVLRGPEVDPVTRTLPIVWEVENPSASLPIGMAVTVHVNTRRAEDVIAIPLSAVVDDGLRPVAFVQVSGETFERRELVLGIRDGQRVQVVEGLAEGERVVARGAYAVRLASVATSIPAHGHAH